MGMARSAMALGLLTAVAAAPPQTLAQQMALAPHRAVYDLTLSRPGKSVQAAAGRIVMEFTGSACKGYETKFRQATRFSDGEGQSRLSDLQSASFESGDGRTLRFRSETRVNERVTQRTQGTAERAADGGLSIDLREPRRAQVDVDAAAIFPTDHMLRLIAAAKAGERVLEIKVFDGSDGGQKVYETTALIGPQVSPERRKVEPPSERAGLAAMRRWPVAISYFEPGQGERTPVYVLSFDMFENGVSGALRLDFADFALKGEMTTLDLLKPDDCPR